MARIVYNEQKRDKSNAPNWVDVEGLNKASAEEAKRNEEMLSKIASNKEQVVISWANAGTGKVYSSSNRRLQDQERIAKAAGKTVKLTDPDTGEELVPYKTALLPVKAETLNHSDADLRPEGIITESSRYTNTYVDRHVQYKALEALQTYAAKMGMPIVRARYLRGEYSQKKVASGDMMTFNDIHTEIEWTYGRNQKGRIFCKASIDPAGKIGMPKVFKTASGDTFEFNEDNIKALEKDSTFREMMTIKPKKTDMPTFRRPDISRFHSVSSLKTEAMDTNDPTAFPAQNAVQPQQVQTPGQYTPGQQYTNPADGKSYIMKSYDPTKGAIVTSPEGQDMAVPANEVPNLKPNVQTQGTLEFSVEAMAEELVKKHFQKESDMESGELPDGSGFATMTIDTPVEGEQEISADDDMLDKLTSKKTAGEKGNCSKCGKPNFICRGKCSGGSDTKEEDDKDDDEKDDEKDEKDDEKKEASKKTADIIDGLDSVVVDPNASISDDVITEEPLPDEMLPGEEPFNNPEITPEPLIDVPMEPTPEDLPDGPLPGESNFPMEEDTGMVELPDGSGAAAGTVGFDKLPKLKVISKEKERVSNMAKRWSDLRKLIAEEMEKAPTEGDEPPFEEAPEKISREQQEVQRLRAVGYKGFSPIKNDANEQGRDTKTHIPTKSSGDVEIGMTDYPDYSKPFQEAQSEMIERREHFHNENRLGLRGLKRNELKTYVDDKDEKEYGLSEEGREGEFENPELQFEASNNALAKKMLQKKSDTASDVTQAFEGMADAGAAGANAKMIQLIKGGEPLIYNQPATVQMVTQNPNYLTVPSGEGVQVIGFYSEGQWVIAPGQEQQATQAYKAMKEQMQNNASLIKKMLQKKSMGDESLGEFENPDPFRKKSSVTDEDIANSLINKTAADEEDNVVERPIVHKDLKRAPGLEGWKEPEVIPESESKVKEAITKFRKVQADISTTKEKLQAAIAPIQKKLMETQQPFQEDLKKSQESFTTYLEMIWNQLGEVENKIAAYEDKIFAAVERSKDETTKVSLAQLLEKLEKETPEVFAAVQKVKEAMENEKVTSVLERFLYEYPVSKEHEKKKVVRKSSDEDGSLREALAILKDALMSLLNLEATLEVA